MADQVFIPVFDNDGDEPETVDARELWERLGSKRDYTSWLKYRIKQTNAIMGKHYWLDSPNLVNQVRSHGGDRRSQRCRITTDLAKHWAMMEGTPQGETVRDYFISRDKKLKAVAPLLQSLVNRVQALEERSGALLLGSDGAALDGKSLTDLVMALRSSLGGPEAIPEPLRLYLSGFVRGRFVAEDIMERSGRSRDLREPDPYRFVVAMLAVLRDLRYAGMGGGVQAGLEVPSDPRKSSPAFEQWYVHERDRPWVEKAWAKVVNSLPRVVRGGDRQRRLPGMKGGEPDTPTPTK